MNATLNPARRVLVWSLLAACMLSGCSTRAWYGSLQSAAQQTCERQPAAARESCEARRHTQDFDTYNAQRKRLAP